MLSNVKRHTNQQPLNSVTVMETNSSVVPKTSEEVSTQIGNTNVIDATIEKSGASDATSIVTISSPVAVDLAEGEEVVSEAMRKAATQPPPETTLPISQSAALAAIYMLGSITFFLLIRYSKSMAKSGGATYDNAAAVFWMEVCKLTFSVSAMYYRTGKFLPVSVFREGTWRVGVYYAVPSLIYAVYNNLTYYNLSMFDPGTYQVFMQTRVLFTGVLYTFILKRMLTGRKWFALGLLSFGVASKYITPGLTIDARIVFMLFQASLSAFAGVYNEFLLKKDIHMDVNEQNFFMYSFALVFNLAIGVYGDPTYYVSGGLFNNWSTIFFLIVMNGAIVGIVTSLILKFINVIVKAFASACEVLLTGVLAAMFLGETFTLQDFVACCIVMASIYFYYGH